MERNQKAEELPKESTFSQTQLPPGPLGHETGNGMASSSADWALCPQSADTADRRPHLLLQKQGKLGEDHGVRI